MLDACVFVSCSQHIYGGVAISTPFSEEGEKPCPPPEATELKGQGQGPEPGQMDACIDPVSSALLQKAHAVYATEKHP